MTVEYQCQVEVGIWKRKQQMPEVGKSVSKFKLYLQPCPEPLWMHIVNTSLNQFFSDFWFLWLEIQDG